MNNKEPELIDRFVELRAQGWTFARMEAELGVSKPTLITWSRKHHHRIQNLRALASEALAEQCKVSRQECIANLGEDVQRIRAEIARRNLNDLSTARLFALAALLRKEARGFNGPIRLSESTEVIPPEETHYLEPTVDWEV
jgi:hypothetical protein